MIYCISILENFSRAILASTVSRSKDLTAYLIVLFAAIRQHGSPEALVSDSDGVFKANEARRIYAALGIRKEQIDKKQAWTAEPRRGPRLGPGHAARSDCAPSDLRACRESGPNWIARVR